MLDSMDSPRQLQFTFPEPAEDTPPEHQIILVPPVDPLWTHYFNRQAAYNVVLAHIATLPSSRTPEQHTYKSYTAGLDYVLSFLGDRLPTTDLMQMLIAHLISAGLATTTINSKYLAPARHYLRALSRQLRPGLHGEERDFVSDCRDAIGLAAVIKTPPKETTTHDSPLYRDDFVRLTVEHQAS
jgi:hypothetical protein